MTLILTVESRDLAGPAARRHNYFVPNRNSGSSAQTGNASHQEALVTITIFLASLLGGMTLRMPIAFAH